MLSIPSYRRLCSVGWITVTVHWLKLSSETSVSAEHGCSNGVWGMPMWPHHPVLEVLALWSRQWSSRRPCWSGSVSEVLLQHISATSVFEGNSRSVIYNDWNCLVPRVPIATGHQNFAINGPITWTVCRHIGHRTLFKRTLKTCLFSIAQRH